MKSKFFVPLIVILISFIVNTYNIEKGDFVIWDETHFGKFSQCYLDRNFYNDVHPPLGKMLIALFGYIYGQSSSKFVFSSSENFPADFDYVGMRRLNALISSLTPSCLYGILRFQNFSVRRSFIGAMLLVCENIFVSLSRLIVLDASLLFFTSMVVLGFHMYIYYQGSLLSMLFLGISLGCSASVKWLSILTILYVGLYIIYEIYIHLKRSPVKYILSFLFTRIIFFILLPVILYVFFFYIHFTILKNRTGDNSIFTHEFNLRFCGDSCKMNRKYVSFGTQVAIKMSNGFLHSHMHTYPGEELIEGRMNNYQATTYSHNDINNAFYFVKVNSSGKTGFLKNKDEIVLLHTETGGYLCTDDVDGYIGKGKRAFFSSRIADNNSIFIVELEPADDKSFEDDEKIVTLLSRFCLRHKASGQYLSVSDLRYPAWGYNQGEVLFTEKSSKSHCIIYENLYADSENNPFYSYKGKNRFIKDLIELNKQMFLTNQSLTQNPNEEKALIVSNPYEWFIPYRGIRVTQWENNRRKFYLFYNPLSLFVSFIAVLFFYCFSIKTASDYFAITINFRDGVKSNSGKKLMKILNLLFIIYSSLGGYLIHYVPFFFIKRVLYLHHYLPAYFFTFIITSHVLKFFSFKITLIYFSMVFVVFVCYSPLTYGFYDESKLRFLSLLPAWDFVNKEN